MASDKTFVGKGWESQNGFHINISLKKEEIAKLPVNQYGEVKLTVSKRKEKDEKSKATHFVTVDDYVAQPRDTANDDIPSTPAVDDLPF